MKNKRMNLVLGLVLLVFAVTLLAGCGGGDKKPDAAPPAKPVVTQEDTLAAIMAKARQAPGFSYDMVMTAPKMTMNSKVWGAKDKMKMENTHEGKKTVTYITGDVVYMYDPTTNTAMKFSNKDMKDNAAGRMDNPSSYEDSMVKDSLKFVENVVYDGVKCRVVTFIMKDDGTTAKMWLREDYGMPMRQEIVAKNGEKFVIEYKNMKIGALPPETFQLPAGAQVQDMQDFMRNIPKGSTKQ